MPIDPYKVLRKMSVERYTVRRQGDGNRVLINLMMNGMPNAVNGLLLAGSSGNQIRISNSVGYENIDFPFSCKISYTTWNKLRTSQHDVIMEFEVNKPGDWQVNIHN